MLSILLKLGEQLSENRNEWEDIIDTPHTEKANNHKLWVAQLVFDLDQSRVYASNLEEYDQGAPLKFKNIRIQGGNNKAIYVCAETGKLDQIKKTLFGKELTSEKGEFVEVIDKDFHFLKSSQLYKALNQVFSLKDTFLDCYGQADEKGKVKLAEPILLEPLHLSSSSKVVLWYASVISTALNIKVATPFNQLSGYDDFIRAKFLDKAKNHSVESKISYVSGKALVNTTEPDFTTRYSINKMFVKETKNYASGFDDTNFGKNYQANVEEQLYLERASQELLDKQQVRIAGIDHCVIPKFLNSSSINIREVLYQSLKKSELLFQVKTLDEAQADIHHALVETEDPYWVNFLGFESDGTFFKTINVIKGVSSLHLAEVIKAFDEVNRQMKNLSIAVNWNDVMTDFIGKERGVTHFNLHTLYYLIPQRKEKKNDALGIFKSVLERRKTRSEKLFAHFCNLILCHYHPSRYEAYKNVRKYPEGFFDFAVRDAVFKYLAFIKVLKYLKLLDPMENVEEIDLELLSLEATARAHFEQPIEHFFRKMEYSPAQKAMFYLGRMLSTVAHIQKDKRESVLEKVNFNGMDRNEIQRLRNSLIEKAKLYNKVNKVIFTDGQFTQHFDFNGWHMPEQEAVFFLLSGYSFGIQLKEE